MHEASLLANFNEDCRIAEQLAEVMEREFLALSARDLGQLDALLEEKRPLLSALEKHARERGQLMRTLGVTADQQGLEKLVQTTVTGPALLEAAEKLQGLLEKNKAINLRNGRVIHASQSASLQALRILRGAGETADLYDNRGTRSQYTRNNPWSQA
jgi:flagellar biosynthesis/type III secretory pathway chaperone